MPRGKVKWFNNAKGYGFIIEDGCSDDLFAHFSSVQMDGYKTLKAGQTVSFEKKPSDKGVHAVNIVPDEQADGQTQAGATDAAAPATDPGHYQSRAANS
ncbi:cold shock domain-containing protein [Marinobacter salexigens]|uniref:cold shock domain-containing protein n=1 Tax=Marinobacter salexigens TaxID=1925763 RepID=UPI000C283067|nr:cold shock domain-containing protein [Marinobacter salexigens]